MAKKLPVSELFIGDANVYPAVFKSYTVMSASKAFIAFFNSIKDRNVRTDWSNTKATWYMLHIYNQDGSLADYCAFTDRRLCTERGFLEYCIRLIAAA